MINDKIMHSMRGCEMNAGGDKPKEDRFRFSIAGLLILTSLVAIHLAFPPLLIALLTTFFVAIVLAILMFPVLSANRVGRMSEGNLSWGMAAYLGLVGFTYFVVAGFLFLRAFI